MKQTFVVDVWGVEFGIILLIATFAYSFVVSAGKKKREEILILQYYCWKNLTKLKIF